MYMYIHESGGDREILEVVNYCYLGIRFADNGLWDSHGQKVINKGKKKHDNQIAQQKNNNHRLYTCVTV